MLVQITQTQLKYLHFLEAHEVRKEPDYVSQNEAYRRFGRANVERWGNGGKVNVYFRNKSGTRLQYKLSELTEAAAKQQDYKIN